MSRWLVAGVVAVVTTLGCIEPVYAKGKTVKLTISGPGLSQPLELTKPEFISADVFVGNFVAWQRGEIAPGSSGLPRYAVQFHVRPPRSEAVSIKYVVYFAWDPATERGLVYLPGPGERWYNLNISTIDRGASDGKWYLASDEWSRAIRGALP